MRVGGPLQWCGPNRVAVAIEFLDRETIGTRRHGLPSDAADDGRGNREDGAKSDPGDSYYWLRHPADEMNEGSKSEDEAGKHVSPVMDTLREPPPDLVGAKAAGAAAWHRSVSRASDTIDVSRALLG